MGLFSSQYQTVVSTVVQRVIKDDLLPNSVRTGVTNAIFQDTNISEEILEQLVHSIAFRADRMYEYGRDHYAHGLPSGQFAQAAEGKQAVEAVLSAIEGQPVTTDYCYFSPPNMQHLAWMQLVALYGYDTVTNELAVKTAEKGLPNVKVYLDDMAVVVPASTLDRYESTVLQQWGLPARWGYTPTRPTTGLGSLRQQTPVIADPNVTEAQVKVDIIWQAQAPGSENNGVSGESFVMALPAVDTQIDYFQAKYSVGGVVKYWSYQAGLGTHPTLDGVFDRPHDTAGTFFPFLYFRFNKTAEDADKTAPAYITGKRLAKYLGMNYDQVASNINANPDIDNVEQAMVVMAVPASSTDPLELRYLYAFFDNLYYSNPDQFNSQTLLGLNNWFGDHGVDLANSGLLIQDKRFRMALTNAGLTKKRVVGNIGAVGTHALVMDQMMVDQVLYDPANDVNVTQSVPIQVHCYRKQVTPSLYDEIRVVRMRMQYDVFEKYWTTGDDTDAILMIPIDRSVCESWSLMERETLYSRSLYYVFNSRQIVEIKWYMQDWFQFAMFAVAAVLTILSFGTAASAFSAALAAGDFAAISAAALSIIQTIVTNMVVSELFKLFVKAVGGELALVIAVVAAVVAGYQILQAGSIAGAPWAQDLLKLANGLSNGMQGYYGDEMKGLAADYQTSLELEKKEQDDLNSARKLLENNNYLSPFVIFGESPNEFYNRTVHSGNIGVLSISAISNYVDTALRLPRLEDTLGDSAYG